MRRSYVTIYDLNMQKVAYLENAFNISYQTPMNNLWGASFSLPANDPKNVECKPLYFAEIFDDAERLELFRVLPSNLSKSSDGMTITYECEHVLGTLLDDILFQYHTVGNLGVYTADVIRYVLSKQSVQRWQLGTVQFNRQFEYNWENENLLGALYSVPKPFDVEYMWTFDTTAYPWTLNLVQPSNEVEAYIRYGVNMQGIERKIDPSGVVTRLYGLGYGEGVNQLTFASINGGKPYIDAEPEYIQRYGIMQSVYVDRRIEYPETLLANSRSMLNQLKQPMTTYTVRASELYALTHDPIDKFRSGAMVRVQDKEIGEDVTFRVMNVRKGDVLGNPGAVEIDIANKPQDIAGTIADLRNRQYINDVYAQGATNFDSNDFADNCDQQHPAILRFWIPEETARINVVSLGFECQPFRATERSLEAAPTTSSGPSSTTTTQSAPAITSGSSSISTTYSGGGSYPITETNHWTLSPPDFLLGDFMNPSGGHNHGIADGTQLMTAGGGAVTWSSIEDHRHSMYSVAHTHTLTIASHSHNMEHTHDIPAHTHGMDHTHEIPSHTHDIEFGIYEGPTPTAVSVRVDGTLIPGLGTNADSVNIIPFLSKDEGGKVLRGAWHEIEIAPNSLGRIVASVHKQIFVQSRGGGNY